MRVPKFSEDPQHREIADENAPFEADWFMVMERSLETGSMAHRWDETAKAWFVKVAMESLKANAVTLLKRHRGDLGTLAERAQHLIGPMGDQPEVDEATVRGMMKSGREFRENGSALTIEIAVMSLGIKSEINASLSVGFKRDTMRLLKQIIAQMLERRDETWNLIHAKMESAPKGIPPDDQDCPGDDTFWLYHQGLRVSNYIEELFGTAHPYAVQSNMTDRFDVLAAVLKRLDSEFPEDQRRVAAEYSSGTCGPGESFTARRRGRCFGPSQDQKARG